MQSLDGLIVQAGDLTLTLLLLAAGRGVVLGVLVVAGALAVVSRRYRPDAVLNQTGGSSPLRRCMPDR